MLTEQKFSTVTDLIQARAKQMPDRTAFLFLESGERESDRLTFGQLDETARTIAARLQCIARPGDRVLLLYPPGLEFIRAWTGCLYAGLISVPAYPPQKHRSAHRLQAIVDDATPVVALTDSATLQNMQQRGGDPAEGLKLEVLATDRELGTSPARWQAPPIDGDTLALLQYTSGSTGTPKGVMISHRNVLSNMEVIEASGDLSSSSVFVSWLPVFHDMGFFGKVLQPIYHGVLSVLMPPAAFVQKPVRWLQAVSKYRGTVCAAPDFAYDLCVRKVSEEAKEGLDLSSWSVAFNGAEPVRPSTVENFIRAFAPCGFRPEAMRPVYGMAESTLFIAGQTPHSLPETRQFDAQQLAMGKVAEATAGRKAQPLVSCGHTYLGHQLRIVDPDTGLPSPEDRVGEIWLSGPSVGAGYWNRFEETERNLRARLPGDDGLYLRTGDLGFQHRGDLFVTGRIKDVIIVAGRNHYPQDLERTAEGSHPALNPSAAAAFSIEVDQNERVAMACEVRREALATLDPEAIAASIRRRIAEEHELELHTLLLLKPATILRTSSGKIQRSRIRQACIAGEGLEVVGLWRKTAASPAPRPGPAAPSAKELVAWFVEQVAKLSGMPAQQLDPLEPFSSYGLESKDAIALTGELQDWLGRPLSPTLVYDFPSIARLAEHLTSELTGGAAGESAPAAASGRDIAIVGMSCRFPGAADPEAFWRLLLEGGDAVAGSAERVAGLPASGLLEQVDQFDADFFGINAREAQTMDPQQRLLLEMAWEALEHAGVAPRSLAGSKTAVMVGISNSDYIRIAQQEGADVGPYVATGNALSVAANRISYTLDLRGPSWAVDTACSSSLVAVHQACRALRYGECDAALAGGVNLILAPQLSASFAQSGMLSADGRCKAFDASANGYVRGEGAGMVLLKRLADAQRDGDTVLAVIRGSAVNQDGRSNGLTAPNGPAQQAAIREALQDAGVQAKDVGLVETHGTGTPLGDPIELNSLVAVLNEGRRPEQTCWVGSVKTNIGHLESAAGIASLIKTVQALRHRQVPPHLHYQALNPHIALDRTPFRIAREATPWASGGPRIAGVSSFGFGGTNAHLVLAEAAPSQEPATAAERPLGVLALSARTPAALQDLAAAYADFIDRHPDVRLQDLAYTAHTGRNHFEQRLAVVAADLAELRGALAGAVQYGSAQPPATVFRFAGTDAGCLAAARELARTSPGFRQLLERQCEDFEQASPELLFPSFQYALASLWTKFGVTPRTVTAEGAGQRAAAAFAATLPPGGNGVLAPERVESADVIIDIAPAAASWTAILETLAELYRRGATIDWAGFEHGYPRRRVALPSYPFQRQRHWLASGGNSHPLLGRQLGQQAHQPTTWAWESRLDGPATAFLDGHRIMGTPVLSYAAYVEMALTAAAQVSGASHTKVSGLTLHAPLFLRAQQPGTVQTVLSLQSGGQYAFAVYHRAGARDAAAPWQICASAEVHEYAWN